MARFRPLALSALIVGLVTLAALGVRQVIVGQEGVQPETDRQSVPLDQGRLEDGILYGRGQVRS